MLSRIFGLKTSTTSVYPSKPSGAMTSAGSSALLAIRHALLHFAYRRLQGTRKLSAVLSRKFHCEVHKGIANTPFSRKSTCAIAKERFKWQADFSGSRPYNYEMHPLLSTAFVAMPFEEAASSSNVRSRTISTGFTKWWEKPAAAVRCRSSGWP